jgi:hypothetical protein
MLEPFHKRRNPVVNRNLSGAIICTVSTYTSIMSVRSWELGMNPGQGFGAFLEWCVDMVGGKEKSAKGHFRHAGWTIEEPDGRI